MHCLNCGGLVVWDGPITAPTNTKCLECGAINNQAPEETEEDEDEI